MALNHVPFGGWRFRDRVAQGPFSLRSGFDLDRSFGWLPLLFRWIIHLSLCRGCGMKWRGRHLPPLGEAVEYIVASDVSD